jgi:hypothetical protein
MYAVCQEMHDPTQLVGLDASDSSYNWIECKVTLWTGR